MTGQHGRQRLRRGELLAGTAALVLLVVLFALSWTARGGHTADGWDALPSLRWLLLVTALASLALAGSQATLRSPAVPVSLSVAVTVLAVVGALALLARLLAGSGTPQAGAWLGLALTLAITVGGVLSMREEQGWRPGPGEIETVPLQHRSTP